MVRSGRGPFRPARPRRARARCMIFFSKIYEIPRRCAARPRCASFLPLNSTVKSSLLYILYIESMYYSCSILVRIPTKFSTYSSTIDSAIRLGTAVPPYGAKDVLLKIAYADRTPRETLEKRLERTPSNARCFAQGLSLMW